MNESSANHLVCAHASCAKKSCGDMFENHFSQSQFAVQKKNSCGEMPRRDATGEEKIALSFELWALSFGEHSICNPSDIGVHLDFKFRLVRKRSHKLRRGKFKSSSTKIFFNIYLYQILNTPPNRPWEQLPDVVFPCRNSYWWPQKKCVPRVVKNQSDINEMFPINWVMA